MRILLSSIGSRGDVQPILALALELQALGHQARLCVAPNFKEWIESYGVECVPIGPDLKKMTGGLVTGTPVIPTPEQIQQMVDQSVRDQFQVIGEAAKDCQLVVGAGALQIALRSIAEAQNIPYVFAAYCPMVLPSAQYAPPKTGGQYSQALSQSENLQLWKQNESEFNARFGKALNEERAKLGLAPVASVQPYMFTNRPWLAADPVLGPAFPLAGTEVVQTGAWMLWDWDQTPLPAELETFLANGAPPVYLGFGSMRASDKTGHVLLETVRALGLRAILSQGWAGLTPDIASDDIISIGDVSHAQLFPRVAAVVHHGGAGTTTTAARAGRPQVIVPHNYDQFFWAHRIQQLGLGASGPARDNLTTESLLPVLQNALQPTIAQQAQSLSARIEPHGARIAAQRLVTEFAQ